MHEPASNPWAIAQRSLQCGRHAQISEESIQKQLDIYRGETLGVGPMLAYAPGAKGTWPNAACILSVRSGVGRAHAGPQFP